MTSNRKYKTKKVGIDVLRKSKGKIATEDLFYRDMRLAKMFNNYLAKNIRYLKRYEEDQSSYDLIEHELDMIGQTLKQVEKTFKEYNKEEQQ